MRPFLYACAVLLLVSCSADRPTGDGTSGAARTGASSPAVGAGSDSPARAAAGGAGTATLTIDPAEVGRGDTVRLIADGFDLAEAAIRWRLNGQPFAPAAADAFETGDLLKGDRLQAVATVQGQELRSNIVEIQNTPPELAQVTLVPAPGPSLAVEASATDVDNDDVTIAYEWTRNGEPAGESRGLGARPARGDKLTVRVVPFDGSDYGRAVTLENEVANLPPVIVEDDRFTIDGDQLTHQVQASDPDGDALTFSLKAAPPGMKIDAGTGRIDWMVPAEFTGEARVTVTVADGRGAAQRDLIFRIAPPPKD